MQELLLKPLSVAGSCELRFVGATHGEFVVQDILLCGILASTIHVNLLLALI